MQVTIQYCMIQIHLVTNSHFSDFGSLGFGMTQDCPGRGGDSGLTTHPLMLGSPGCQISFCSTGDQENGSTIRLIFSQHWSLQSRRFDQRASSSQHSFKSRREHHFCRTQGCQSVLPRLLPRRQNDLATLHLPVAIHLGRTRFRRDGIEGSVRTAVDREFFWRCEQQRWGMGLRINTYFINKLQAKLLRRHSMIKDVSCSLGYDGGSRV